MPASMTHTDSVRASGVTGEDLAAAALSQVGDVHPHPRAMLNRLDGSACLLDLGVTCAWLARHVDGLVDADGNLLRMVIEVKRMQVAGSVSKKLSEAIMDLGYVADHADVVPVLVYELPEAVATPEALRFWNTLGETHGVVLIPLAVANHPDLVRDRVLAFLDARRPLPTMKVDALLEALGSLARRETWRSRHRLRQQARPHQRRSKPEPETRHFPCHGRAKATFMILLVAMAANIVEVDRWRAKLAVEVNDTTPAPPVPRVLRSLTLKREAEKSRIGAAVTARAGAKAQLTLVPTGAPPGP